MLKACVSGNCWIEVKRAQPPQMIHWCAAGLLDMLLTKTASIGELSVRQLTGNGLPGGKGILDTLIAKEELAMLLIKKFRAMGVSEGVVGKLEVWHGGHASYREMVGFKPGDKDQAWRSAMRKSGKLAVALLEGMVIHPDHDLQIKQQKIQGSSMGELLDRSPLKRNVD